MSLILFFVVIIFITQVIILVQLNHARKIRDNEYYTDYKHNNLTLRIYKPEFEYKAIGGIPRGKLLDCGTFSQFYNWALIDS